ncbi:MAG: hypothetical protein QXG39_08535 [Candidatus Aenigmatarchaeota archaeon]
MPSSNGKVITVSKKFANLLYDGHKKINDLLSIRVGKKITFIDYTDFLADLLSDNFDLILSRGLLFPIKKGRKAKTVELEFEPII